MTTADASKRPTARREAATRIDDYVRRVVAEAPPLGEQQLAAIRALGNASRTTDRKVS
jgi:hypothetical protein